MSHRNHKKTSGPDPDAARALAEAEAIRRGEDPAKLADRSSLAGPGDIGAAGAPAASAAGVSTEDGTQLANLTVVLTDAVFVAIFGAGAEVQEPLRAEAVKAWGAVIVKYLPLIQKAGPWGALAGVYITHAMICAAKAGWMTAPSPAP